MNSRAQARVEAGHTPFAAPTWVQTLMALAGVALLIGPTLGVLWPR